MKKLIKAIKKFLSLEGELFRYAFSYSLLLALFPCLFLLVYLYQTTIINIMDLLDFLYLLLPSELIKPLVEYLMLQDQHSVISTFFSVVISIVVASQSFYSFLILCAEDEEIKVLSIAIRIKAVYLFIVFIGALIFFAILSIVVPISMFYSIPTMLLIFNYLFYHLITFRKYKLKESSIGALFSTVALLVYSTLFFWIIRTFTSYESIYGPLSSVVILLLSVYVVSNILYFGYCLNVVYRRDTYHEIKFEKGYCWLEKTMKVFKRTHK